MLPAPPNEPSRCCASSRKPIERVRAARISSEVGAGELRARRGTPVGAGDFAPAAVSAATISAAAPTLPSLAPSPSRCCARAGHATSASHEAASSARRTDAIVDRTRGSNILQPSSFVRIDPSVLVALFLFAGRDARVAVLALLGRDQRGLRLEHLE